MSHEEAAARTSEAPQLRRAITRPALLLFVVGDVLGAGTYTLVGEAAVQARGALWLALLVALALALLTAASYVELVTRFPRAGGAAVFAHRAFRSDAISFLVGFCGLAAGVTSWAPSRSRSPASTSTRWSRCRRCRSRWRSSPRSACSTRAASASRWAPTSS